MQLKLFLKRLAKPSVLISIASQVVAILMVFNIQVDMNIVTTVITGVCSILVLLGIVSDPGTKNSGFGDDVRNCVGCKKKSAHVTVGGKLICKDCGTVFEEVPETIA